MKKDSQIIMPPKNNKYPCHNNSLTDLKAEQWKDIPGFDGYYRVSNFGRIKRMKREQMNSRGVVMVYKERILAPRIYLAPNHYVSDFTYQVFAHFSLGAKRYHLPVRRLVYYCFVKPFDLKDKTISILCKNGNGLDLQPRNLKLASLTEASKRVLSENRRIPEFKNTDPHKAARASIKYTAKQISQYNHKGKKIKTYPSTMEASRQLNINNSAISAAARGRERTSGGYFWNYGNATHFDVETFLEKRRIGYKEKKGTKVTQYDLNGNRVAQFLTLKDAAKSIGKDYTGISAAIRGIISGAYGYIWKRGWGKEKITVKKIARRKRKS